MYKIKTEVWKCYQINFFKSQGFRVSLNDRGPAWHTQGTEFTSLPPNP